MKHLEKGRSQRLAGKRKSNKPSKTRPSAARQQQLAQRKRTRLANQRKREKTLAKQEKYALAAAPAEAVAQPAE